MRLPDGARIAVIGAGPAARRGEARARGRVRRRRCSRRATTSAASGTRRAAHSGVWPGMHTNTSRAMTAFSDFPAPAEHPLHPAAEQIHAYLRAYADALRRRRPHPLRHAGRATCARAGRSTASRSTPSSSRPAASGTPRLPPALDALRAASCCTRSTTRAPSRSATARALVYGNGISGLEIASDLAPRHAASSPPSASRAT